MWNLKSLNGLINIFFFIFVMLPCFGSLFWLSFRNWNSRNVIELTEDTTNDKKVLIVLVINVCLSAMASLPCLNCMCENATVKLSVFTVRLAVLGKGTCLSDQLQFNCLPNVCGDLKSILHMKYQVVMFEELWICFFIL